METRTNAGGPASVSSIQRSFAILNPTIKPHRIARSMDMGPTCCRGSQPWTCFVSALGLFLFGYVTAGDDPQIIRHLKSSGYLIGANAGQVLVALTVYHALQGDAPILHNDVDGRNTHIAVLKQRPVTVNGLIDVAANAVVHRAGWQHFDVVDDLVHTFNALHHVTGVGFQDWFGHLSFKHDRAAINLEREIVEDVVIRQHNKLVPDLTNQLIFSLRAEGVVCSLGFEASARGRLRRLRCWL